MTWLLRLYPRVWQERYRDEVAAILDAEPLSFRLALDLLGGAVDARINPQWPPPESPEGGHKTMESILRSCMKSGCAAKHSQRNGGTLIGVSLALVVAALALQLTLEASSFTFALILASFPIAMFAASIRSKPYSLATRILLFTAASVVIYGLTLGVLLLGERF